jgi:hypothetical protein
VLTFRPFVSKGDILRAYNPGKPESESAFRRLRKEGVISEGITIKPRSGGRQRGTITAFYALNEDAAIAYRHGDVDLALKLSKRAAEVESSSAARELIKIASAETIGAIDAIASLDGMYALIEVKHRKPLDMLAERVVRDRSKFNKRLDRLGARYSLAWLVDVHEHGAELKDEAGLSFSMPRTPELLELADEHAPVSVRTDLMNGVLMTFIEKAYAVPDTGASGDPFGDLRPALPDNLSDLLDEAPLRPLALTGPGLRWA